MQKEFAGKEMKKEDVVRFTKDLIDTVDDLREHLLDPDGLLLSPELIFIRDGRYRFCYLPVSKADERQPLCASFHVMTEYFVKKSGLSGIRPEYYLYTKMHKETLRGELRIKEDHRGVQGRRKGMGSRTESKSEKGEAVFRKVPFFR